MEFYETLYIPGRANGFICSKYGQKRGEKEWQWTRTMKGLAANFWKQKKEFLYLVM